MVSPPHRLQSDERLAALAASGDEGAFAALYGRYERGLLGYCRSITSDPDDARDALQNAMVRAVGALRRRRLPDAPVRPWLYRIAHNESVNVLRRRRGEIVPLSEATATGTVAGADERTLEREAFREVVAKVVRLPPRQRGALVLRAIAGLEYRDVASALDVSEVNARQLVFAARSGLGGGRRRGLVAFLPKCMLGAGGALQGLFGAGAAGEMATSVAAKGAVTLAVAAVAAGALPAPDETPLPARGQGASVAAPGPSVSASRAARPESAVGRVAALAGGRRAPGAIAAAGAAARGRSGGEERSGLALAAWPGDERRVRTGDARGDGNDAGGGRPGTLAAWPAGERSGGTRGRVSRPGGGGPRTSPPADRAPGGSDSRASAAPPGERAPGGDGSRSFASRPDGGSADPGAPGRGPLPPSSGPDAHAAGARPIARYAGPDPADGGAGLTG